MGSREERIALVPTHPGRVALPALTITWWNTEQDRLERTELPARELDIQANPDLVQPPLEPAPMREAASAAPLVWPWQLGNLVLACTTLLGFGLWLRARRQPAVQRAAASGPSPRTLLDDIRRACLANDSQATRQALDAWARNQPETLADMAARFVPLSDALDGLNGALYSETGQQWQGDALWQAIQSLRRPAAGGRAAAGPAAAALSALAFQFAVKTLPRRPCENVASEGQARRKQAKKRSLQVVNEHFDRTRARACFQRSMTERSSFHTACVGAVLTAKLSLRPFPRARGAVNPSADVGSIEA